MRAVHLRKAVSGIASGYFLTAADVQQVDWITFAESSTADDEAVEGKLAVEFPHDFFQHTVILFQSVGIEGRHDTAATQILDANAHLSAFETPPRPLTFGEAFDAADNDVRAKAAAIVAKTFDPRRRWPQ